MALIEIEVPDGALQFLDAAIVIVNATRAALDPPLPAFTTREEYVFAVGRDDVIRVLEDQRHEDAHEESVAENAEIAEDFNNG